MNYIIQQTKRFAAWHRKLKDLQAKTAIARRIEQAQAGNLGDVKALGGGLSEMRVHVGKGYRVYFVTRQAVVLVLLAGGNKTTQKADIARARQLQKEI